MKFLESLRHTGAEAERKLRRGLTALAKLATYTLSSSSGKTDKVDGYATEGSDQEEYDVEGRRMFPFGLRSRPPKGVDAVWIAISGGATNGVIVAAESSRYGPDDLDDGELAIYNKVTGCVIKLDKNGKITIDAPAGQDVVVNAGTKKVARVDDTAKINPGPTGPLGKWMGEVETALNILAGGSVTVLSPTFVAAPGIVISSGADRFKG